MDFGKRQWLPSFLTWAVPQGPFVDTSAPGSANTTDSIEKAATITNSANGFSVTGFNVTYTADAAGNAGGQYRFSLGFTDTVAQMVQVTISGSSYVTESPGATAATLNNFGTVTEGNTTIFTATSRETSAMALTSHSSNGRAPIPVWWPQTRSTPSTR